MKPKSEPDTVRGIYGARARLKAFIERHAETFDEAKFRLTDLLFLVYRARRMK